MFWIVPSWCVTAEMPETGPGDSALATPHYLALVVSDDDLEAVLRSVKRSGYEKVAFERNHHFGSAQTMSDSPTSATAPAHRPEPPKDGSEAVREGSA